jgi:hypothetical protein
MPEVHLSQFHSLVISGPERGTPGLLGTIV